MTKENKPTKVYKQWTVQSSDLEKFDDEINSNIEIGWETLDGSFLISEIDGKKVFSQVLIWKDEDSRKLKLEFSLNDEWQDGVMDVTGNKLMTVKKTLFDSHKKDSYTVIKWEKSKFGSKYSKEEISYFTYTKDVPTPQLRKRNYKLIGEDREILKLTEYNEDGIRHGEFITDRYNIKGRIINGDAEGQDFLFTDEDGSSYRGSFSRRQYFSHNCNDYKVGHIGWSQFSIFVWRFCLWTVLEKVSQENPVELLLEKSQNGELQLLMFSEELESDHVNVPDSYFDGQIIDSTEDSKFPSYFIKSGRFIEFGEKTGKKLSDTLIIDGIDDCIKSGRHTIFSHDTGKKLKEIIIENGYIKEENVY